MTIPKVIESFVEKGATADFKRASSVTIVGDKLYSYNTAIAKHNGTEILLTPVQYSQTTTRQQNLVKKEAEKRGIKIVLSVIE